jgi:hypothetical protein
MRFALARRNDEHLHQIMVGGRAGGLHKEAIFTAHVFLDLHEGLAIGKRTHRAFADFGADAFGDGFREGTIGRAAKNFHRCYGFRDNKRHRTGGGEGRI